MGMANRGNGGSSPGRLRNAGLCHFALDVAKNFFVGFFLLIFLQWHKAIMSCPERQERSVQTSFGRNLPLQGQVRNSSPRYDRGGCLSQKSRKTAATLFLEEDI
jgi:hypothetical protein